MPDPLSSKIYFKRNFLQNFSGLVHAGKELVFKLRFILITQPNFKAQA